LLQPRQKLDCEASVDQEIIDWIALFERPVDSGCARREPLGSEDIDYAQLQKIYGKSDEGERRYSPPECIGCETRVVEGNPDPRHISTSYVERNNLTMRMHMRRFTRLTNAFSKKVENHAHAVALHFMYYNFCKLHKAHRLTPAMAAGVTDRLWEVADIVKVLEDWEAKQ